MAAIGAGVAGVKSAYDLVSEVTSGTSAIITAACQEWRVTKAAATARIQAGVVSAPAAQKATNTMPWLDATCDPSAPPPADPVEGAIWLAGLAGRIDQITQRE